MFRNLLIADLASDIGTFMQSVGAAWLMVSLGASTAAIALTQTAATLPFFLLALPAGAIGDIVIAGSSCCGPKAGWWPSQSCWQPSRSPGA